MFDKIKIAALKLDMNIQKLKLEKLEKDIKAKNEQLKLLDETKATKTDRLNANFLLEDIEILENLANVKRAVIKKRDRAIKAIIVHKGFKQQAKQSKQIFLPEDSFEDMFTK